MNNAAQTYRQTQMTTIHQGDIIVLLFDTALRHLNKAKEQIAENDMPGKGISISKAIDVINGLDSSLNMEKGEGLAENLHNLYFLSTTRLLQANLKKDPEIIDGVIGILNGLREAFVEVLNDPVAQTVAQQLTAKNKISNASFEKRNITDAPSGGVTKNIGKSVYAQAADNTSAVSNTVSSSNTNEDLEINPLLFQTAVTQKFGSEQLQKTSTPSASPTRAPADKEKVNPLLSRPFNNFTSLTPEAKVSEPQKTVQTPQVAPTIPTTSTVSNAEVTNNLSNPLKKGNPLKSSLYKNIQE